MWLYNHGENTNNQIVRKEGLSPEGIVRGTINYQITVKQYITDDKFADQAKVLLYKSCAVCCHFTHSLFVL